MLQQRIMTGKPIVLRFLQCLPQALCVCSCRSCLQQQKWCGLVLQREAKVALLPQHACSSHPHSMPAAT